MMYRAVFEPILSCGISVWGNTYKNVLHKFQTIQNDAMRTILGLPRIASVRFIFKQEGIFNVEQLCYYKVH